MTERKRPTVPRREAWDNRKSLAIAGCLLFAAGVQLERSNIEMLVVDLLLAAFFIVLGVKRLAYERMILQEQTIICAYERMLEIDEERARDFEQWRREIDQA